MTHLLQDDLLARVRTAALRAAQLGDRQRVQAAADLYRRLQAEHELQQQAVPAIVEDDAPAEDVTFVGPDGEAEQ